VSGRVLVFGSRGWTDRATIWNALGAKARSCVIQGDALGGDRMGKQWARFYRVPLESYPADWKRHLNGAGVIRNTVQLAMGKPDEAIGGIVGPVRSPHSKGSADMLRKLIRARVPVQVFRDGGALEGGADDHGVAWLVRS
jgi:hypothetical protein